MRFRYFVLSIALLFTATANLPRAYASPTRKVITAPFRTPAGLRKRVDFWKDIFTKYGKEDAVFHHRDFPQIIFDVLSFRTEALLLPDRAYAKARKKRIKARTSAIQAAFKKLAAGKPAESALEKGIAKEMEYLGPGLSKFKAVVKDPKLVRSQTGIKEKYAEALKRSGRYMHILEDIFTKENGLPVELTRLPFIESSFDYKAYSSVGAAGIWQFMRRTGRAYMKINYLIDERRDVVSSTRGAAKYLLAAYNRLGNWPLALTSYNHGVYGVAKKVKKAGTKDIVRLVEKRGERPFGFASTNFYPEFLAALEIYADYEKYFPGLQIEPPLYISYAKLKHSYSVNHVIKKLGIPREELEKTNYALGKNIWKGRNRIPAGYVLKVPIKYGKQLAVLRTPEVKTGPVAPAASSVYGGVVYRVRRGDTLSRIAKRYGKSVSWLREQNNLSGDMVKVGQLLVVEDRKGARSLASGIAEVYTVQRGDTLSGIARKFGISTSKLRSLNGMRGSRIYAGQRLKLVSGGRAPVAKSRSKVRTHKVRRGDTLWSISKRYGVGLSALKAQNKLRGSKLAIGQRLTIP